MSTLPSPMIDLCERANAENHLEENPESATNHLSRVFKPKPYASVVYEMAKDENPDLIIDFYSFFLLLFAHVLEQADSKLIVCFLKESNKNCNNRKQSKTPLESNPVTSTDQAFRVRK